jgi:hypothetical protein
MGDEPAIVSHKLTPAKGLKKVPGHMRSKSNLNKNTIDHIKRNRKLMSSLDGDRPKFRRDPKHAKAQMSQSLNISKKTSKLPSITHSRNASIQKISHTE